MVLLTAAQIATALQAASYSEVLNAINPYVILDDTRREYPSVDVENVTGQEKTNDVPTISDKQSYLIHLYYRVTGFGDADEPNVKLLEDEIFNVIDALQTTDTKITIIESWNREHPTEPTPHIHSTLRVTTQEISSKTGGIVGDQITITFPSPIDTLDVIDVISDDAGIIKDLDISIGNTQIYTKIRKAGLLAIVVAVPVSVEDSLKSLFFAGNNFSITFTKGGAADVRTANPVNIVASGTRGTVQRQTITMDIIY